MDAVSFEAGKILAFYRGIYRDSDGSTPIDPAMLLAQHCNSGRLCRDRVLLAQRTHCQQLQLIAI
jgi:hypothetical protein